MKSFPSSLTESKLMYGSTKSQLYEQTFDIERLRYGALNLTKSAPVIQEMFKEQNINISNYQAYPLMHSMSNPAEISSDTPKKDGERVYYENPLELPPDVIALAKDYDWIYKNGSTSLLGVKKSDKDKKGDPVVAETTVSPSMFNPLYGVSVFGLTRNTPLLNDSEDALLDKNVSDCSIRTLCALSKLANSPMGQARYKYADFMYCKDLGKVANNHLITLRKFAHPVGDHIFRFSTPEFLSQNKDFSFQVEGDVGRLVTWFGTDDNKLEDICKYSYHATWLRKESDIEQKDSKADDPSTGILGMISNSFSSTYAQAINDGTTAGTHSIFGWLGSKINNTFGIDVTQGAGKNKELLTKYDQNKVYNPTNTIQETHIYEGKLEFTQQFTLNFSYKLRAYDNINPRSALLDLIGNILEVTYRRGAFWGGARQIIGPPQSTAMFDKTSAFIDENWDKLGGMFKKMTSGGVDFNSLLGSLGSLNIKGLGGKLWEAAKNFAEGAWNGATGKASENNEGEKSTAEQTGEKIGAYVTEFLSNNASEAAKGFIKNSLGRPSLYAWQSLLTGDDVGLWHVTIGNPRNPILSMGNLILDDAVVTHSGPLGIDDFPTELKVSITLKHARPRDITEIGRMYTQGASALYHHFGYGNVQEHFGGPAKIQDITGQGSKTLINPQTQSANANNTPKKQSEAVNQSFVNDIEKYAKAPRYDGNNMVNDTLANPFIDSAEASQIIRTNNWSSTMLAVSLQEVA